MGCCTNARCSRGAISACASNPRPMNSWSTTARSLGDHGPGTRIRHRDLPKGVTFQLELDSQVVVLKPIDRNLSERSTPQSGAAGGHRRQRRRHAVSADAAARDQTNAQASVDGDALGKIVARNLGPTANRARSTHESRA
jgi:hypothetical protein